MEAESGGQRAKRKGQRIKNALLYALCSMLFAVSFTYAANIEQKQGFQFGKNQEIKQVKPKKPVRIKLHRNAKGEYSWELTGDNVDEVFQADRRLRKLLKVE